MTKEKQAKSLTKFLTPFLIVLLIGAAFISGSFWTEFKSVGKKADQSETAPTPTTGSAPVLPEAQALGAEDQVLIGDSKTSKGDPEAPVIIVEFSEFLCPFCAEHVGVDVIASRPIDQEKTYQRIMAEYIETGKVRYIFRHYPIHGDPAKKAAEATLCARDQEKFWEYHDLLFENFGFSQEDFSGFAAQLGMNLDQFSECLSSGRYAQAVEADFSLGQKMGVSGTPTFFINGRKLGGAYPFESFKTIIEEELAK
jgi:protein-disulfide isomerase